MGDEENSKKGRHSFSPVMDRKVIYAAADEVYESTIQSIFKEYPDIEQREIAHKMIIKGLIRTKLETEKKYEKCRDALRDAESKKEFFKKRCELMEALLGLTNRIELLESLLYPSALINVKNRILKWKILLELRPNHPVVKQLRNRILDKITIDQFVKILSELYESYSNNAIRKTTGKVFAEEEMKELVEKNKGNLDEFELMIVQVLFVKIDLSIQDPDADVYDDSFRYIKMAKIPSDNNMETKIRTYFRSKKSIVAVTKEKDGIYVVEFDNINEAIAAFTNHEAAIDNRTIHLTLSNGTTSI